MSALRERFLHYRIWVVTGGSYLQLRASLPVWKKLVPISLLGDQKGGYMSDCVGGCQKSFVCGIDAGGFCDVLFRVIMTYLIDIDLQNDVCLGLFC